MPGLAELLTLTNRGKWREWLVGSHRLASEDIMALIELVKDLKSVDERGASLGLTV